MARNKITEDDYYEMLDAWAVRPTVKYVSKTAGFSERIVSGVVREGVPDLHLPPFPSKNGKPRKPKKFNSKPKPDPQSLRKATVIAHTEAQKHIKKAKEVLSDMESAANKLGKEADTREMEEETTTVVTELEAAAVRAQIEEQKIRNVGERALVADATRRAADEAAMARVSGSNCLSLAAIMSHTIDKLMDGIENGEINLLPKDANLKTLTSLTVAAEKLTSAMERVIKIDKGRAGEPDNVLGIQIGVLLDGCSDDELDHIMKGGALPNRLKLPSDGGDSN